MFTSFDTFSGYSWWKDVEQSFIRLTLKFDGISGPSANRRESNIPVHQPSNPAPAAIKVIDLQPEVGVYPTGEDSNIIHARQVPAGLPLPQQHVNWSMALALCRPMELPPLARPATAWA